MLTRPLVPACALASLGRRGYLPGGFRKEVANIAESSWKSGRGKPKSRRIPTAIANTMFVQDANDQSAARPCFVPRDSDMHRALVDQPVSRRGIPFNPWTLLLELLDDPRVAYDGSPEASRCILSAIAWMGGVTPHNMLKRRDELVRALLKAKCIRFDPKLSTGAPGNVELGSAQLMQLYQIQWPRFIAEKYRQSMSVPSILCRETQSMANAWDRAWAVTNICAEQLKTSAVTHRVLFNSRFGNAAQRRVAIHEGFVYAPGMAMNAILGSQEDLLHIVGPDTKAKICNQYFANIDTFRSAVVAAWQLYDWLIHSNPHKNAPPVLQRHFTLYEFRLANQRSENSSSSLIYRGLCAFDNLREATDALQRLDKTDTAGSDGESVRALDRKLVERYMYLVNSRPVIKTSN